MQSTVREVRLVAIDEVEFAKFARSQVVDLAWQHVMAGEWKAQEAEALAREELADLLAGSLWERDGHLFLKAITRDGAQVGSIRVSPAPAFMGEDRGDTRWLSQITVEEGFRGQGYGRGMLVALHEMLVERGVGELWLRVYDWNDPARRLYAWAGYEVMRQYSTDAHLRKRLGGG
jgi:GNAT superfamily N-acetyltransferase